MLTALAARLSDEVVIVNVFVVTSISPRSFYLGYRFIVSIFLLIFSKLILLFVKAGFASITLC